MNTLAPEEIELNKKQAVLERLTDRLADREEEMADLRAGLEQFEARYTMQVGRLYADLDEIEAQIAEEEYKLVPDDEEIKKKAEQLRRLAEESAEKALKAEAASNRREPSLESKRAYHNLARSFHPDLALDAREKEKRHGLMARLNDAYASGDQATLNQLAADVRNSPDLVKGDSVGDNLVRALRQISQVTSRIKQLRIEKRDAKNSELYALREKMRAEAAEGRDMIRQIAARTVVQIKKAERRLANLRAVNAAAEKHVRDEYGLDIAGFR